ncbi:hypothetical protein LG59_5091 [Serratia ureilytica]|uniref:hypothetical protein n=1 Tax=Serratia ureilytica TaxID=300181 RepID=UPI00062764BD|nr:hypothetical protein [Serratia ureilytica]KKO57295.1 hypothetical protein LG59_5091 [Serratia ureilytica]
MDNKLSELSKPVAYDYQIASACIADGHNENGKWVDWNNKLTRHCPPDWMMEEGKVTGLKLLYSQEYVSALLAELKFEKQNNAGVAGMVEDYETKLEAKDKRIAELEQVPTIKYMRSVEESLIRAMDMVSELEKLLATPVQLQNCDFESVAIMAHWCTDEQLKAWVKGVEHAKKQIAPLVSP